MVGYGFSIITSLFFCFVFKTRRLCLTHLWTNYMKGNIPDSPMYAKLFFTGNCHDCLWNSLVAMGLTVAKSFVTNSLANFTAITFIFSDSSISKCTNHIFAGSTFSQAGATTNNLLSDCRDLGKRTTTDLYFTNA